ncbi:MAG: hypothetical protein PHC68_17650, partial [Syntrophorhabdaceae bacterium]|nr:hypothetical protein [Syntrophorhabdaceae bacterium]
MCTPSNFKKMVAEFEAKQLFDDVLKYYEHYFYLESKMLYHLIALFSINQCVFDAFDSTPYLYIRSPLEECGKTNLGKSIQQMWNGIISTNLSSHHVFRMIHGCSPTFIFDESKGWDSKAGQNDVRMQDMLSVINSGYQRGVPVYRFKDSGKGRFGEMKPEAYDSYSPKVIITTQSSIPRDTQSRCAEIMMQRAPKSSESPDYADRWTRTKKGTTTPERVLWLNRIRRNAAIFRLKYGMEIKSWAENENWKDELDLTGAFGDLRNRHLEIFKPLVILCLKYKPEWADITAKYIKDFISMREKVTYSKEITVLWALRKTYQLVDMNRGELQLPEETPIKFEETEAEGQVMWVSAKHIRHVIDEYALGTTEEFGKYPESKIGRILTEFGFVGTSRTRDGNLRKIKTSRLTERCLNYLGVKLSDEHELSQQERMELVARTIRERMDVNVDDLYDILNGQISQEQIIACVKTMRTNGVITAAGAGGKGKLTWCGAKH